MEIVQQTQLLRDFGDGLVLRRSTPADAEALADFNSRIHGNPETGELETKVAAWTRDLLEKPHPTFHSDDFTIVEDTLQGKIVSSMNLIDQTWSYEGIRFEVGRPEIVGTDPEYRNRGLVRAQFEEVHRWGLDRGQKMQVITGIPYYYRLFGYEMALDLGGGRAGYLPQVPKLGKDQVEPFQVRPAVQADIPFIQEMYAQSTRRSLLNCVWDDALWAYELSGKSEQNVNREVICIIAARPGEPVGVLMHPFYNWGSMMAANFYEVKPGISWGQVTPSVIRYLIQYGESCQPEEGEKLPISSFGFWLGSEHPVYHIISDRLPRIRKPYAWYIRIADLPDFLRTIKPVLEERLGQSPLNHHTGELKITFYRSGLRIKFEQGRLAEIEPWTPEPVGHAGEAAFPGLTFLQLLMGYRSCEELSYAFPDCWTNNGETETLLNALFPKRPSCVLPVS